MGRSFSGGALRYDEPSEPTSPQKPTAGLRGRSAVITVDDEARHRMTMKEGMGVVNSAGAGVDDVW